MQDLRALCDPSDAYTLKGVLLTRRPRRRKTSAPFMSPEVATWRHSMLLLPTGHIVKEEWTKMHGTNSISYPEGEYQKFKPAWVVHLFDKRKDLAPDVPSDEMDPTVLRDSTDEPDVIGGMTKLTSLGRLTKPLQSKNVTVQLRALRLLHERFTHASVRSMNNILLKCGLDVPEELVRKACDLRGPCRMWSKPAAVPKISTKDPKHVGHMCEADFKFFEGSPCFHIIDRLIKFHMGDETPTRAGEEIRKIIKNWLAVVRTKLLCCDKEGAVAADPMGIWLQRRGVGRRLVAREAHLGLAERHGEIWIDGARRLKAAARAEGVELTTSDALSESMEAKNGCLLFGAGHAPIQGLTGTAMDWDSEMVHENDEKDDPFTRCFWKRCLAVSCIAQAVYQQKVKTATASKVSLQDSDRLEEGCKVEFWLQPKNKDVCGWTGPGTLVEKTPDVIAVRWQGVRRECAPHLVRPWKFQAGFFVDTEDEATYVADVKALLYQLQEKAEGLKPNSYVSWGVLLSNEGTEYLPDAMLEADNGQGMHPMRVAREYAHEAFGLAYCAGVRCWNGMRKVPGVSKAGFSVAIVWPRGVYDDVQSLIYDVSKTLGPNRQFQFRDWQNRCGCMLWSFQQLPAGDLEEPKKVAVNEEPEMIEIPPPEGGPLDGVNVPVSTSSVHSEREDSESPGFETAESGQSSTTVLTPPSSSSRYTSPSHTPVPSAVVPAPTPTPSRIPGLASATGGVLGTLAGETIGEALAGPTGGTIGGGVGERVGESVGEQIGQVLSNVGTPRIDTAVTVPAVPQENQTAGDEFLLPGLPLPVEDGDDFPCTHDATCSSFLEYVMPGGLPPAMQAELDRDNELKLAFLSCCEGGIWDVGEYWTDVKTGFTYRAEHLKVGELTKEEEVEYWEKCLAARRKELLSWHNNQAFRVILKSPMHSSWRKPMTSRWVYTWKVVGGIGGELIVTARLCVKGFQDAMAAILATIAATTSLLEHRIFAATAVNTRRPLTSMDVSEAFLKGLAFEETAEQDGVRRRAYFDLPKEEDYAIILSICGLSYALLVTEWLEDLTLEALKGGFGLKDAPRRFRLRLDSVFKHFTLRPSIYDVCVYYLYPAEVVQRRLEEKRQVQERALRNEKEATSRKTRKQMIIKDISTVLWDLAVNTHVDDLENICDDKVLLEFRGFLEQNFGPVKLERAHWTHVGAEYRQNQSFDRLDIGMPKYPNQLKYIEVSKERRRSGTAEITAGEQTDLRGSAGGNSWFARWRLDIVSRVQMLQSKCSSGQVKDLLEANALTRYCKDTAEVKFVYKALPRNRPCRLVLWPDAAKGDYSAGSSNPVLAYLLALMVDHPTSLSGLLQILDALGKRATRESKSSLHAELLGACQGVERAEEVAGIFEEMYVQIPEVLLLLKKTELGSLALPLDLVTGAKSLYDCLTREAEPKPRDEGALLWLIWLRERLSRGSVRRCVWTTTHDMVSDGLTKILQDQGALVRLMNTGEFNTTYSCLCNGVLWEPWKGLPPPKRERCKDEETFAFLTAFSEADGVPLRLALLGISFDKIGARSHPFEEEEEGHDK